jgi:hypothetical protein
VVTRADRSALVVVAAGFSPLGSLLSLLDLVGGFLSGDVEDHHAGRVHGVSPGPCGDVPMVCFGETVAASERNGSSNQDPDEDSRDQVHR